MADSSVSDNLKAATTLLSNRLITQSCQAAAHGSDHAKQDDILPPVHSTNLCQQVLHDEQLETSHHLDLHNKKKFSTVVSSPRQSILKPPDHSVNL